MKLPVSYYVDLNISNVILAVRSMSKGEEAKILLQLTILSNCKTRQSDAPRHG